MSVPFWCKGEAEVWLISLWTLAQYGGKWLISSPGHSASGKGPQCSLNRRLDGLQSQSGRFWRKISWPYRDSNPYQTFLHIQYEVTSYVLVTKLFNFIYGHSVIVSCQSFSEVSIYLHLYTTSNVYYLFHSKCSHIAQPVMTGKLVSARNCHAEVTKKCVFGYIHFTKVSDVHSVCIFSVLVQVV
jgi:hypothetical protein